MALYFSVSSKPSARAQVIVFRPDIKKQKYYDSHTVSILSSLALMSLGDKAAIRREAREFYKRPRRRMKGAASSNIHGQDLTSFNESPGVQKLFQIVRQQRPEFEPIIQPVDLAQPVSVVPRQLHKRILAQSGAFILFGLEESPTTTNMRHIEYEVIDIEQSAKARFQKELSQLGITESALFPEIDRAALAIKGRYS